jgi:MFS family permease
VLTVSLSRITGSMFITTGVLLVLTRTHSAALAGATVAAGTVSWALSAPLLGAWLDVARRRRVLIVVDQLISVVALVAMVALAGHAPGWTLPADAVLLSITRPFSVGSFFSALSELAGADLLDRASAVEATSMNLSFVVGPALAGVIAGVTSAGTAVLLQAGLTLLVAVLIGANPVFEARSAERPSRARDALRDGLRALRSDTILVRTGAAGMLAMFGWGLMAVGFPLYAARTLHAGAHAGGYLWAGLAIGSIIGTFALAGEVSLRRVGGSYAALGLSALLWPLGASLAAGFALITLTGFLEGPAYSGTIALRQRHTPPAIRGGTMSTINGFTLAANAAGSAIAGVLDDTLALALAFTAVNLLAGLVAAAGAAGGATKQLRSRGGGLG